MLIVFESRQDAEVRNPEVYLAIEVFLTIIFFTEISVATWACTLDLRLHPKIKQSKEEFVAENPAAGMEGGGGKKPSPRAGDADGSERTLQRRKSHSITTQIIEKRNWRARLLFLVSHPSLCGVLELHQPCPLPSASAPHTVGECRICAHFHHHAVRRGLVLH